MSQSKSLNIILIEPFYAGSHKAWADGYQQSSQHNIQILSLAFKKHHHQSGAISSYYQPSLTFTDLH